MLYFLELSWCCLCLLSLLSISTLQGSSTGCVNFDLSVYELWGWGSCSFSHSIPFILIPTQGACIFKTEWYGVGLILLLKCPQCLYISLWLYTHSCRCLLHGKMLIPGEIIWIHLENLSLSCSYWMAAFSTLLPALKVTAVFQYSMVEYSKVWSIVSYSIMYSITW